MANNYANILQSLNDGYTIEQLPDLGIRQSEIQNFLQYIDEAGLTIDNAKALNMYSYNSEIILAIKNDTKSTYELESDIRASATELLEQRGLTTPQINKALGFVEDTDYNRPLYQNFAEAKEFFAEHEIPKSALPTINTAIKETDTVRRAESIVSEIDDALSKSTLSESIDLYRAIKLPRADASNVLDTLVVDNPGYTSTSPEYESSFAKYEDYNVVLKMHAPEGTHGIALEPFSDYDSVEKEVLLGANRLEVSNVSDVIDNDGNDKTLVEGEVVDCVAEASANCEVGGFELE